MKSTTTVEGNDLVITRHFQATPMAVWQALSNAETLKQWFVPRPWRITYADLQPHAGGRFRVDMAGPDDEPETCAAGSEDAEGCVLLAEPGRRLVWTDALASGFRPKAQGFMTADVTLTEEDGGTRYSARVLHTSSEARQKHEDMGFAEGWGMVLEQLAELLGETRT